MKTTTFFYTGAFLVLSALVMKTENTGQNAPLYNTKWALKKIQDRSGMEDVFVQAFLRLNQEKQSAGGNGGCNSFGSTLQLKGNQIGFRDIFSTKMFCEGVQDLEDRFFNLLGKVNRYEIDGQQLHLFKDNDLLLVFNADNK